jgi:hypothetical protein
MPTTARIMAASQAQSEVGLKERFYREFQHQVTCKNFASATVA